MNATGFMHRLTACLASIALFLLAVFPPATLANGAITEYSLASSMFSVPEPLSIIADASGMWFTEDAGAIGQLSTTGMLVREIAINDHLHGIALGADGNLWVTGYFFGKIYKVATTGSVTTFSLAAGVHPEGIVAGPDGNLWFTEPELDAIGQFSTAGVLKEFPAGSSRPFDITVGPDGAIWYTLEAGSIGRRTTDGLTLQTFALSGGDAPLSIASGADGNLWFTQSTNQIGRISPVGVVTEFSIPTAGSLAGAYIHTIALGPDGDIWFTEPGVNQVAKITAAGVVTEYPVPTANSGSAGIVTGPDGRLWFAEIHANQVGAFPTTLPVKLQAFGVD